MRFSRGFEEYHRRILGSEYGDFIESVSSPPVRGSVRVNTLKSSRDEVEDALSRDRIDFAPIPWCCDGLWVSLERGLPEFEHQLGFFYVQGAGSMIPPVLLDAGPGMSVLDLCAAPGSKATQLAQSMGNEGVLVANEPNYKRIRGLVFNLQRCGVSNCVVTKFDGCGFEKQGLTFDRVLVDAPCSGVGTAGKNRDVLGDWSLERVKRFSGLQKKLIVSGFRSLKPGGVLVYSTCTTSLGENEEVVEHVLDLFDDAQVLKAKPEGLVSRIGLTPATRNCLRVYSFLNGTGSYFIAKIGKNG
ncbi:MAG: RsmB/NOP family class I SAM-dependent RNA methyltransferase [Candidatus Altiarchaeota archaeon]